MGPTKQLMQQLNYNSNNNNSTTRQLPSNSSRHGWMRSTSMTSSSKSVRHDVFSSTSTLVSDVSVVTSSNSRKEEDCVKLIDEWMKLESIMTSPPEVQILLIKFPLLYNHGVTAWMRSNMTSSTTSQLLRKHEISDADWLVCPVCFVASHKITKDFKSVQKSFKILKESMTSFKKLKKDAEKSTKIGNDFCRRENLKIQFEIVTMCHTFNQLILQLISQQKPNYSSQINELHKNLTVAMETNCDDVTNCDDLTCELQSMTSEESVTSLQRLMTSQKYKQALQHHQVFKKIWSSTGLLKGDLPAEISLAKIYFEYLQHKNNSKNNNADSSFAILGENSISDLQNGVSKSGKSLKWNRGMLRVMGATVVM